MDGLWIRVFHDEFWIQFFLSSPRYYFRRKILCFVFSFQDKNCFTVRTTRRVSLVTVLIFVGFNVQFLFIGKKYEDEFGEYCSYGNVSGFYVDILFSVISAILNSYGPFVIMILCNCAIVSSS